MVSGRSQRGWVSFLFFFSSRRRHTRLQGDWSSDVCSSDLLGRGARVRGGARHREEIVSLVTDDAWASVTKGGPWRAASTLQEGPDMLARSVDRPVRRLRSEGASDRKSVV